MTAASSPAPGAASAKASLVPYGATIFSYFASIGLMNPYSPLWLQSVGFSTLAIGLLSSLQAWTRVVAPYGWSWVGDHWGSGARRHLLLRIAAGATLLCAVGLLVARAPLAISVVIVLLFLANAGMMPLIEAALSQRLVTSAGVDVGRYGRVRVWGSIGFIVVVSLSGWVLQATGIEYFPAFVVLSCAAIALAAWTIPSGLPSAASDEARDGQGIWGVLRRPVVAWFFAGCFLTVLAHTALYVFLSLYLVELGYGKTAVGLFWAVGVAVEIVFFWTQGRWFGRFRPLVWLVIAAAACVVRFAAMSFLGASTWVLVFAQSLHALTFAAHHAACINQITIHFPGRLRGRGQALYSTLGYGLSGVIGGVAGGAIVERFGLAAVFVAALAASVLALLCCWRCLRLASAE